MFRKAPRADEYDQSAAGPTGTFPARIRGPSQNAVPERHISVVIMTSHGFAGLPYTGAEPVIDSQKAELAPEKLMRIRPGWPATLREPSLLAEPVVLRPYRVTDARAWREIRVRNAQWLRRWEMTDPESPRYPSSLKSYLAMVALMRRDAWLGRGLSWAVTFGDQLVGHASLGSIVWGSERTGVLGAWVDEAFARHGIGSLASAMVVDHGFGDVGLHRIVASVQPENKASRQGVEKYFREEGLRVRQSYSDGAWRDHLCYALTAEEVPPGGYVALFRSVAAASKPGAGDE